jgi:hypothetical protein
MYGTPPQLRRLSETASLQRNDHLSKFCMFFAAIIS